MSAARFVLLVPLVMCEMYLFTAFLPMQWQRTINDRLPDILAKSRDLTPITHPRLSEEVTGVIDRHHCH
jgi:hypothetical protein